MKHGIVIPCYNEASRLDLKTFISFAEKDKSVHLCFVNDGSADATRGTLAKIRHEVNDNVFIYHIEDNAGKANAVRKGALYLYEEAEVDTVGFLDADLSTSFEDYGDLIESYEASKGKLKVIFGSRNMGGETEVERNPLRKLLSSIIWTLIYIITRLKINDTQCGAKIFDRELIPLIYNESFFSRWLFDVEILLRLKHKFGASHFLEMFLEQPLKKWVHMDDSKLGLKDSIMIPMNLFQIWREYEFKRSMNRAH